ncbi:hypothetical protein BX666DRAFT_957528 [Dichotomocladium elegans]|nr:hypothetical protein BX666DRAFT_957528 [Dichotomocladium elegans]
MLIRFTVITSSTTWQRHVMPRELSEKKTFKPKSVPIAKITTVHVAAEDPPNRVELGSEEEKQSAVIALSVELTKQLSRNLYPYRGVPLQHTLFVQQLQYQGSSRMVRQEGVISSSSSGTSNCGSTGSNNPAKAIAETTLTRVSAGGDITIQLFPDVETHSAVAVLEEQHRQAAIFEMTCDSASTQTMIRPDDSTLPQHRLNLQQEMFPPSPDVFLVKPPSERRSISVNGNPVLPPFEVLQPPSITNPQLFDQQLKSPTSWFGTLTGLFTQRPDHDRPGTKQNEKFSAMISGIKANKLSRKIVIIGVHGWFPMKVSICCIC